MTDLLTRRGFFGALAATSAAAAWDRAGPEAVTVRALRIRTGDWHLACRHRVVRAGDGLFRADFVGVTFGDHRVLVDTSLVGAVDAAEVAAGFGGVCRYEAGEPFPIAAGPTHPRYAPVDRLARMIAAAMPPRYGTWERFDRLYRHRVGWWFADAVHRHLPPA